MLSRKEQLILLRFLKCEKLTMNECLKKKMFTSQSDFYATMQKLSSFGLIHGSAFWSLTLKGRIRAKLIALDPNNDEDYTKNLRSEIIEFVYNPND